MVVCDKFYPHALIVNKKSSIYKVLLHDTARINGIYVDVMRLSTAFSVSVFASRTDQSAFFSCDKTSFGSVLAGAEHVELLSKHNWNHGIVKQDAFVCFFGWSLSLDLHCSFM